MNRYVKGSLFFLIFTLFYFYVPHKSFQSKSTDYAVNLATVKKDYAQAHEKIMAQIQDEFLVPSSLWQSYMQQFLNKVAADDLLLPPGVQPKSNNYISSLLIDHGINPRKVKIKELAGNEQAEAMQDLENGKITHLLGVNFKWLKTRPAGEQEAILRHEIQHLLNYDSLEDIYIRWILTQMGYTKEDWENSSSMTAYHHFRELRADALACGKNKALAQSLHDYFCDSITPDEANRLWYTHPRDSVRAHQIATLYNLNSTCSNFA